MPASEEYEIKEEIKALEAEEARLHVHFDKAVDERDHWQAEIKRIQARINETMQERIDLYKRLRALGA